MPRISLCIIVRDEAEMLAGRLESAAPAVDEIIVLDTGSTDNTREIVGDCEATVIPAAWTDFRTARNQVLRRATGDWALVLDADEEVILKTPDQLRELADSYERLRRRGCRYHPLRLHAGNIREEMEGDPQPGHTRTMSHTSILPAKTSMTPSSRGGGGIQKSPAPLYWQQRSVRAPLSSERG